MTKKMTRREFAKKTAAAGIVAAAAPTMLIPATVKPVVISSANGNWFKNGGSVTAVQKAFEMITKGTDVLDAVVAGVNIVELDPEDDSVGYGGLPNAEGVVQLDSCCMHGPRKQAGGVAALEGIRTPSLVAKTVLEQTDHHLLVGKGAQSFAHSMGFKVEDDLNTEHSRKIWLEWKRRTDPQHYLNPKERSAAQERVLFEMVHEGILRAGHLHGTINCDGINSKGEICGVTTTSGLAWKIPGRVGDSPILGAGLYVDGAVGAAGSTGRGEANLYNLSSYLIVENMRRGMSPKDAGLDALKRIKANTVEKRLLKPDGNPKFNMQFYILNARGEVAGVAMYSEDEGERGWAGQKEGRKVRYAVCDENGPRFMACEGLLPGLAGEVYP